MSQEGGLLFCVTKTCVWCLQGEGLSESEGYIAFNKLVTAFKVSFPDVKLKYAFANRSFHFSPNSSVQFSRAVVSDSLWPHGLQHARLPCPSPTPRAYSNSSWLSWWCHPTISPSVIPFSFCLQSFPASRSFPMNQFFASGGQSIGVSPTASVLPMNIQDWFRLGWTGWISL